MNYCTYIHPVMVAACTNMLIDIEYAEKFKFYVIKIWVLIEIKIYQRTLSSSTSVVLWFGTNETAPSEIVLFRCVAFSEHMLIAVADSIELSQIS